MDGIYMVNKNKRFVVKENQSIAVAGGIYVIVDTNTGVNYLLTIGTGFNGITPLLDSEGKVVIDRD